MTGYNLRVSDCNLKESIVNEKCKPNSYLSLEGIRRPFCRDERYRNEKHCSLKIHHALTPFFKNVFRPNSSRFFKNRITQETLDKLQALAKECDALVR